MAAEYDRQFLREAIALAKIGIEQGIGGPFGCVIVKDGVIVGKGCNQVTSTNDPCRHLGAYQLTDCDLYTSCEPCPMCLGAIYWARPRRVIYACTRHEAADAGFDDAVIYEEINVPIAERRIPFDHESISEAAALFGLWREKGDRKLY
jgi:tRNA(Arg) A34 adenosine deaminase TadA